MWMLHRLWFENAKRHHPSQSTVSAPRKEEDYLSEKNDYQGLVHVICVVLLVLMTLLGDIMIEGVLPETWNGWVRLRSLAIFVLFQPLGWFRESLDKNRYPIRAIQTLNFSVMVLEAFAMQTTI